MIRETSADFSVLKELDHTEISTTYRLLVKLEERAVKYKLNNATDVVISLSRNGVDEHMRFMPNSFDVDDLASNSTSSKMFFLKKGTTLYIKAYGDLPTENFFWFQSTIEERSD